MKVLGSIDTTAPTLERAVVGGTSLVLIYDEPLDEDSVPGTSAFSVSVAGSATTVSSVAVTGSRATLTLATTVTSEQTVTVSYAVPTGEDAKPIQDRSGNDAGGLTNQSATQTDLDANDATLSSVAFDVVNQALQADTTQLVLSPAFHPEVIEYQGSVAERYGDIDDPSAKVTATDDSASIEFILPNGSRDSEPESIPLQRGSNTIFLIVVTAGDTVTTKTYRFRIARSGVPSRFGGRFSDIPDSHDGTAFTVTLHFDEDVSSPVANIRNAIEVTAGTVSNVAAVGASERQFTFDVTPAGTRPVSFGVRGTLNCSSASAVCSAYGFAFSGIDEQWVSTADDARLAELWLQYTDGGRVTNFQPKNTEVVNRLYRAWVDVGRSWGDPGLRLHAVPFNFGATVAVTGDANLWNVTAREGGGATARLGVSDTHTVTVTVTSANENNTRTYDYTIEPDYSKVCIESAYSALSSLTVSGVGGSLVRLSPAFNPAVRGYVAWMSPGTAGITVSSAVKNSEGLESSDTEQTQRKEGEVLEEGPREGEAVYVDRVKITTKHRVDGGCNQSRYYVKAYTPTSQDPDGLYAVGAEAHERPGAELQFKVQLRPAQTGEVTVDYATADGTAKAGLDYIQTSGTLTFAPGETEKTVTVTVLDDEIPEGRETVLLKLSNASGAYVQRGTVSGSISNSELTGAFESVPAAHDGTTPFTLRIAFNQDVATTAEAMRDEAVEVTGGDVTGARQVDGRADLWELTVQPSGTEAVSLSVAAGRACTEAGAVCAPDDRPLSVAFSAEVAGPGASDSGSTALTASFSGVPSSHDGSSAFSFTLTFSEDVTGLSSGTLRDSALQVSGGSVTRATRQTQGSNLAWTIEIEPDDRDDVTVSLPQTTDCAATGAICTSDGRKLSELEWATVEGPVALPLTASFSDMPSEHDGENTFTFTLTFSENVGGLSFRTLKNRAFQVRRGKVVSADRHARKNNQVWTIEVQPRSHRALTIVLPQTTDCAARGAICAPDGRMLSNESRKKVKGPPGLSVVDAEVDEGAADAALAFAVKLSRAASGAVTVEYATSDGTATAGADYTSTSGTLTFAAGETEETVSVPVLDDSHDDDGETLTLTLSNASGAHLADATATGTINNSDPLPRALMARFGRAAAVHVVEHVEERLQARREPGFRGRFAGRELRRGMERDVALGFLQGLGSLTGHPAGPAGGALPGMPGAPVGSPGLAAGSSGMAAGPLGAVPGSGPGGPGMAPAGSMAAGSMAADPGRGRGSLGGRALSMGLGGGDPLAGSAFALNRETHGGVLSFWSRGAQSHFSGREGELSLGGDVRTTMFGADYARGPLVAGLSLSHSRGLGEYAGASRGQVASAVTGLYPWLGYKATERVTVWGTAGYGAGAMLVTLDGGPALETGLSMAMAAAGTRGELVAGGAGGFALAFKADALWVGTASDGVDGPTGRLAATEAAVTRVRTGLEGSRAYTLGGRLSLKPVVEVGLRHDGGDAETGAGMDIGGGLVASDAATGLAVDVRVRTLVLHQAEGFRERGVALSVSYTPTPSTPLGFTARVAPSWGGRATSGAEALWGRETMAGMANGGVAAGDRLDAEVGYGLPVGSRLVGTPRVGVATSEHGRDYRLGYGMTMLQTGSTRFQLGVDAQRRESALRHGADHAVLGRATVGW